jgi:hypothetical protein
MTERWLSLVLKSYSLCLSLSISSFQNVVSQHRYSCRSSSAVSMMCALPIWGSFPFLADAMKS